MIKTIRRQAEVMASHSGPGSSTVQTLQLNQIQSNVIKTIRRQAKVMASHSGRRSSTAQTL